MASFKTLSHCCGSRSFDARDIDGYLKTKEAKFSVTDDKSYFRFDFVLLLALNTLRLAQNGHHFVCRRHFQMYFLQWSSLKFELNFTECYSNESNWKWDSIGPGNSLTSWILISDSGYRSQVSAETNQEIYISSLAPEKCGSNFQGVFSEHIQNSKVHEAYMGPPGAERTQVGLMLSPWTLISGMLRVKFMSTSCEISLSGCYRRPLVISQHCSSNGGQQAVTWAKVDQVLWCHMTSSGHNELIVSLDTYPSEKGIIDVWIKIKVFLSKKLHWKFPQIMLFGPLVLNCRCYNGHTYTSYANYQATHRTLYTRFNTWQTII